MARDVNYTKTNKLVQRRRSENNSIDELVDCYYIQSCLDLYYHLRDFTSFLLAKFSCTKDYSANSIYNPE